MQVFDIAFGRDEQEVSIQESGLDIQEVLKRLEKHGWPLHDIVRIEEDAFRTVLLRQKGIYMPIMLDFLEGFREAYAGSPVRLEEIFDEIENLSITFAICKVALKAALNNKYIKAVEGGFYEPLIKELK